MNSKMSKKEHELLHFIVQNMSIYYSGSKRPLAELGACLPRSLQTKSYEQALARLRERGFVWGYGLYPTNEGYAALGVGARFLLLLQLTDELERELKYAAKMRIEDKPCSSDWNLSFYRELYKQPTMTHWQMESLERDRIFQNRQNYENTLQELEQRIARVELLAKE